jgi:hypothetical protein
MNWCLKLRSINLKINTGLSVFILGDRWVQMLLLKGSISMSSHCLKSCGMEIGRRDLDLSHSGLEELRTGFGSKFGFISQGSCV